MRKNKLKRLLGFSEFKGLVGFDPEKLATIWKNNKFFGMFASSSIHMSLSLYFFSFQFEKKFRESIGDLFEIWHSQDQKERIENLYGRLHRVSPLKLIWANVWVTHNFPTCGVFSESFQKRRC